MNIEIKKIPCRCGCGKMLRPNVDRADRIDPTKPTWLNVGKGEIINVRGYGYMNNGYFATLRCGFDWACKQMLAEKWAKEIE